MSVQRKLRSSEKAASDAAKKVVVAVKAPGKVISRTALVWALSHVVQPGDCIILVVVVPSITAGRKLWSFPKLKGDSASGQKWAQSGSEQKFDFTDSCFKMMLDLHHVYDPNKINIKIKVVSDTPCGAVAIESKHARANWVVMDRQLKHEEKCCIEELHCNIVVMKGSQPKILRLNLAGSPKSEPEEICSFSSDQIDSIRGPVVTPNSSPDIGTPFSATEAGASSVSSSEPGASPFLNEICSNTYSESTSAKILSSKRTLLKHSEANTLAERFTKLDRESGFGRPNHMEDLEFSENVLLSRSARAGPPPLCSICQHKAPVFGKPPRWFSYAELELATGGFSQANFLAEGGFGSVHRGVLLDGQPVAVKQHKLASSQGDLEFCAEVEVLSCAQHRNVVLLIGFCVENNRRLLVYEYICNGSLDSHLYGRNQAPLDWAARQKVAVGAARGLRYLHEECRVGCIVHRDMRPNNILITHDFEPLVGDFGLARWQPDGDKGVETRVIGTFGYLAPEYAQSGQITEKADVYSFGVVLLELITGRKAVDIHRPKGQQCLTEWARPLLEVYAINELIDPSFGDHYPEQEVLCMLHAASLCIRRDLRTRPHMSQILRVLEGDTIIDSNYMSAPKTDCCSSRSRRLWADQQHQHYDSPIFSMAKAAPPRKLSQEAPRATFQDREKARRTSGKKMLQSI